MNYELLQIMNIFLKILQLQLHKLPQHQQQGLVKQPGISKARIKKEKNQQVEMEAKRWKNHKKRIVSSIHDWIII